MPAKAWVLTAVGQDRPGIVARVTKLLFEFGCNLEDSAMTRLGGEFAIMLLFTAPPKLSQAKLEKACQAVGRQLKLALQVKALKGSGARGTARGPAHLISVYGGDRPGIVYRVSQLLAGLKVNISDLSTHRTVPPKGRKTAPLYLMLLEVELPARVTPEQLDARLRRLAKGLGCEVSLRSAEADVL